MAYLVVCGLAGVVVFDGVAIGLVSGSVQFDICYEKY